MRPDIDFHEFKFCTDIRPDGQPEWVHCSSQFIPERDIAV
jgi:hypothetical protein